MGKGGHSDSTLKSRTSGEVTIAWEEVVLNCTRESRWLVVEDGVYDVTRWAYKHPGGSAIMGHYAGQDATEAFLAFHNDIVYVRKFMKPLRIGRVDGPCPPSLRREIAMPKTASKSKEAGKTISNVNKTSSPSISPAKAAAIKADFEILRKQVHEMGLFESRPLFFILMFAHILLFEVLAYLNMLYFGTSWLPYLVSVACYTITQGQASWLQHDFGHLSVFKKNKWNRLLHQLTMGLTKGASCKWWNHMHYQHHSKPNVMEKDPDVKLQPLFVVGPKMAEEVAHSTPNKFPYNLQHKYFFAIGPPLLFPVYFQFMTFRYSITRRCYQDLFWMAMFFTKLLVLYTPLLGVGGALFYYFIVRMAESHWFTWVSQSNHIPMEVDYDRAEPWLCLQMKATCDVEQSLFNDWFTGHLNYQIEHHLFPTMPRHNYAAARPLVQKLCAKHGLSFEIKSLYRAFADIVKSLKYSGEIWYAAYHAYHLD